MLEACVSVIDYVGLSPADRLTAALDESGFWAVVDGARHVVIKPELAGFHVGSPTVTDPALVEALIDLLLDRGVTAVTVVGAADSSALWAENRDLLALSDLLGYRFVTPRGRPYDIVDLASDIRADVFPPGTVLHGSGLARAWCDADLRIVFSKNRTDETDGYALCLDTLLGVLPMVDKDLHYRTRRDACDVVAALLSAAPIGFCLIDAIVSSHGAGGRHAPEPLATHTLIAASDIVLADQVGAMKMGLDPLVSRLFAGATRQHKLPRRYTVVGTLSPYPGWQNVPSGSLHAARARRQAELLDRMVTPWLQRLDTTMFPLKHPLDAKANALIREFFAAISDVEGRELILSAVNACIGLVGRAIGAYSTLFDKDALRQRSVPLGIDLASIADDAFENLVEELNALEPIAADAPQATDELRWRYLGEAILFQYTRLLPIDFAVFTSRVDVARTIGYMNDYLGGVVVPLAHDHQGRPVRQAERNIYLPQPNYLVLYDGKPIDVSKLEVVEYAADRQRLYWKTLLSENASAQYDDGIASFERTADGTRVTITGRQQFTLPLFWQVFDLDRVPQIKTALVTHAYRTFFDRTIANFEALVEGREIRIGRPVDEPALPAAEQIMPLLQQVMDAVMPLLQRIAQPAKNEGQQQVDPDGFVHVGPGSNQHPHDVADRWAETLEQLITALGHAMAQDLNTR